jgi:Kef-type K+ transport system membrane component KefB
MEQTAEILLTIGGFLLLGVAMDMLGRRTFLPRVTLLLILGIIIGREMLDLIPPVVFNRFELIADMALLMIGFLLGGRFVRDEIKSSASQMIWITIFAVVTTSIMVAVGLLLVGLPIAPAILLGCIATATAPAATFDIVTESGFEGRFADLLLSIVAIDDAWALIVFSFGMALTSVIGNGGSAMSPILFAAREIGGAIILGILIGVPAAYLTGRVKQGQPMLTEALGLVFICGGAAIWLNVSFLIASMVMGAVIANLAKHHKYPFHAIENVEWPVMVIFFLLAGASLELSNLEDLGVIGIVYVMSRIAGKIFGTWAGAKFSGADPAVRRWMGIAMLPQAGVAIGMALVASVHLPEYRQMILSIVISTTVFFEIIGPIFTRMALKKTSANS